jgi:hypothetical protein
MQMSHYRQFLDALNPICDGILISGNPHGISPAYKSLKNAFWLHLK